MIYQVKGFTLRVPQLLGHDLVTDYELLTSKVVKHPSDVEEVVKTIRLASKKEPIIVAILAPRIYARRTT